MQQTFLILMVFIGSYLFGAIPFSYLVAKIFSKKNVFEVGYKKSSSSNVVKNVGKVPGILAFLLDGAKGFLVVYFSQQLGLDPFFQALAGVLSVFGHNWSIFVGGKGGRGLATLAGAVLAFSWQLLAIILIPCIILTFIRTAALGTILSLIVGIMLGSIYPTWEPIAILLSISLIPVFIKRLSPWSEISKAQKGEKIRLIRNRLLYDQDGVPPYRLKIFQKKI